MFGDKHDESCTIGASVSSPFNPQFFINTQTVWNEAYNSSDPFVRRPVADSVRVSNARFFVMVSPLTNPRLAFGLYEIDVQTGELWKAGFRIKLQGQPFKVLCALLERPGHIVTREELQQRLWGKDTVVDFDHSLGTAINKIREALGDSAENPRFVETLSRRGYRFIAPVGAIEPTHEVHPIGTSAVQTVFSSSSQALSEPNAGVIPQLRAHSGPLSLGPSIASSPTAPSDADRHPYSPWTLLAVGATLACVAGFFIGSSRSIISPPHIFQVTHNGHFAPSVPDTENLAAVATDGVHLFAATIDSGHSLISAISLTGGAVVPLNVPSEVASPALADISPDGSRLLLRDHLSPESEQPLWVVPTIGGSALRVGSVLAHDATWMPAGDPTADGVLFANGNNLYVTHLNGNDPKLYASLPGRAFWLRWQPNGRLLRFTLLDPLAHTLSLWQLQNSDRTPTRILTSFSADTNQPSTECCGVWTADGKAFIFQSSRGGNTDLWKLAGDSVSKPIRLTDGPLQFQSPVAARNGTEIYFLGVDARSEMQTVSPTGDLIPEKGFLSSAVRVDTTRDGNWVAWTDSSGRLWRARSDGSETLQLTPESLDVFLAHWSPDGSRLAIMAREPGKAWQIYLTSANGGDLQPLLRESRNAADPSWSADGQTLVFGRVNDSMGKENAARTLNLLTLTTGAVEQVPGSDGLFSPRWSPDGRYIAALTLDQRQVRLFTLADHTWKTLDVPSGADPVWSSDSHYLFLHASLDPSQPIERVSIPDGHAEVVVRLADAHTNDAVDFVFGGLTRDNRPMIRSRSFTGNFYSLDLK
jgi:Tol biopolymer transport system component/DNA-binding winged helix-turn-helix (wHTH) protein